MTERTCHHILQVRMLLILEKQVTILIVQAHDLWRKVIVLPLVLFLLEQGNDSLLENYRKLLQHLRTIGT